MKGAERGKERKDPQRPSRAGRRPSEEHADRVPRLAMDYGSPQDIQAYYDVSYYGLGPEADQPRAGEPTDLRWYVASQRRRSSGQTQVSIFSEDELDRYATIRSSAARPGVPPGSNYGGLRRKSTNLDRYVNLSESVNTVTDLSAVSEQLLQLSQLQLPRYVPHLAQIPEMTPLSAELAQSKDATAAFTETAAPPPTPVPIRVPKAPVPHVESPIIVASAFEQKSAYSGKWTQPNVFSHSASTVRSDPEDINKAAVSNAFSSQPSGSSSGTSSSESSGSSSYSSDYESDTSQSISAFGGTVSKSTRASYNEKPPASIAGTPSSVPRTVSSTTMTYTAAKSPDTTVSYASKHSPEVSKKSGGHRSSARTPPSQARTPAELLRSKSKTPPSIAATMIRTSFRSRSKTPASSAKTRSSPRSLSKTPTSIAKTTPISTRPPTPANPTPPPSPKTPTSILRSPQRSSAKTIASQLQAIAAEDQEQMIESMIRESFIKTSEYALPVHISQRGSEGERNPEVDNDGFHSQRTINSQESRLPSVIQHFSQNMENNNRVSSGRFQSVIKQTSYLPSRHSLSHEEAVTPKLNPHSDALIRHGVAQVVRVPVTSVSVPVAKGARATKEYSMDVSSVSRLTRPTAAAPMSASFVHSVDTYAQPIRESRRHLQKPTSTQTSTKRKSRSSKAIQHPDQTEYIKLPLPEGALDSSNFQSSEGSSGRPRMNPSKDRAKTDGSMLMHLCVAINLLSRSTAIGLDVYRRLKQAGLEDCEGTATFTRMINDLFDALNRFFGITRSFGGDEDHPTILSFSHIYRLLSLYAPVKASIAGNVQEEPTLILATVQGTMKQGKKQQLATYEKLRETISGKLSEVCLPGISSASQSGPTPLPDHGYALPAAQECVVYYLCGYIVHSFLKHVYCAACISGIQSTNTQCPVSLLTLAREFRSGSLKYPSTELYTMFKRVEEKLSLVLEENHLCADMFWDALDVIKDCDVSSEAAVNEEPSGPCKQLDQICPDQPVKEQAVPSETSSEEAPDKSASVPQQPFHPASVSEDDMHPMRGTDDEQTTHDAKHVT
ncbi:hypothetical protein HPB52_019305 [Rhipicephalus sanguineus]|uniref:Transposable element P transposase-like GTP-binding insertion domain-containing protein n=1 Tax=Rhipicephalus sanguineus TaxID=34632 RepID=A0A9D4Q814_RHISA|nr:hypothetical protein HPB52_019305 [Rhipicephalus sanguineus]